MRARLLPLYRLDPSRWLPAGVSLAAQIAVLLLLALAVGPGAETGANTAADVVRVLPFRWG